MPDGSHEHGSVPASRFSNAEFEQVISASFGPEALLSNAEFGAPSQEEEKRMTTPSDPDRKPHLSAVPDSSGAVEQRSSVSKWILTLSEPLLSTRARKETDRQMAVFIDRNSQWAANWFAGYTSDLAKTLPPNDPWRRLSAFIDLGELPLGQSGERATASTAENRVSFHNRDGAKPPKRTGAVRPDGTPFGSTTDALDLVVSELGPAALDIGLAAIAEPIEPLTAALIGFAAANVELNAAVLTKVYHHLWLSSTFSGETEQHAGEAFLDAAGSALRWLIHRRRSYTGNDDPFPSVAGFAWMARADRVTSGGKNIASEPSMARSALIDPDAYEQLRNDV